MGRTKRERLEELKRLATERQQTLSSLADETRAPRLKGTQLDLPSFDMGRPMLNVADRNRLLEFLDGW